MRADRTSTTLFALACLALSLSVAGPASASTSVVQSSQQGQPGHRGFSVLDQRPGEGEPCLVCGRLVQDEPVVEIRYRGRVSDDSGTCA